MLAALPKASGHGLVCFKLISLQQRAIKSSKRRNNPLRVKAEEWAVGRKRAGQMPTVCRTLVSSTADPFWNDPPKCLSELQFQKIYWGQYLQMKHTLIPSLGPISAPFWPLQSKEPKERIGRGIQPFPSYKGNPSSPPLPPSWDTSGLVCCFVIAEVGLVKVRSV